MNNSSVAVYSKDGEGARLMAQKRVVDLIPIGANDDGDRLVQCIAKFLLQRGVEDVLAAPTAVTVIAGLARYEEHGIDAARQYFEMCK